MYIYIYTENHISSLLYYTITMIFRNIWCSVSPSKGKKGLLCCIYRSPSSIEASNSQLCIMLNDVLITIYSDTTIIGDFKF